jgi:hypothetical protein
VRTLTGCSVRALAVVVPATRCCASCLSLLSPRICWRVGGTGDVPVEVLFPEGRERFERACSSGWSRVLGIDGVGGAPYCDFANEGGAGVGSRWCPDWLGVTSAGVILDLAGEVGDQVGSLCQVVPPDRMCMERWWNAGEPRQRTWADRRQLWEAPIEDGGHVACGLEVASAGGCQQVAEWVLSGFGREGEQVCPEGRPGGFGGESGQVLIGLVELCGGLGSEELFGCDVEAVGVALDGLEEPGRWVGELAQQGAGGDRRFVAVKDLLQRLGRRARCDGLGSDDGVGVAVADDLQVDVISCASAGEHGVELLAGFLPGQQSVHGVGGDALCTVDGAGVAETGRLADVVGGESDGQVAAVVPDGEVTVPADAGDGPPVAVLDPVGGGASESAVVAAGDDHISDTGLIAVGQPHHRIRHIPVEAMISGSTVEFGDKLAGGRA